MYRFLILALFVVVTLAQPRGSGGPLAHELIEAVVCDKTEMLTCFEPMSDVADIKAAIGKVEIPDIYKKIACLTEEEHRILSNTSKKIYDSVENVVANKTRDEKERYSIEECLRKVLKVKN